ncbi:MAG: ABC transporter substrate-binding protein [Armatimonadota bacterium]|nr:ABC transporter substrate-binding protein [Armatimonadota bacterium]MDR7549456.1 ABC transporter substrate-binding protein [Armatimonadota bacterium]
MTRLLSVCTVVVLLVVATVGGLGHGAPAVQRGGRLTFALRGDAVTLDFLLSTSPEDRIIYRAVYDPLFEIDENLNVVPWLVERWDVSPDGKVYTFSLRRGVKFHDGTDLNAEAVKINFDRILNPANRSPLRADMASVQRVDVVDSHTVRVALSEPFAPFLSILTDRNGYIVSPAAIERHGRDLSRNPVGTGPFQFVEWVKDDRITFRRNAAYWRRGEPFLDELVFRVVPDDTVRLTMLRTGQVDLADWVDPRDVRKVKASPHLAIYEVESFGFDMIRLNVSRPPFDNKLVRQAFAWAVDREALRTVAYRGTGSAAVGPIPPRMWAFDSALRAYSYDPNRARALLQQAGLPGGVSFALQVRNVPLDQTRAQLVQQQIAAAGLRASIQLVDIGTLLGNLRTGAFEASQSFWSGRVDPDGNMFRHFHTSAIQGGTNFMRYSNAQVDRLLDRAREITDVNERRRLYAEAQRFIVDDAPMIFTNYFPVLKAASKRVQGLKVLPDPSILSYREIWLQR